MEPRYVIGKKKSVAEVPLKAQMRDLHVKISEVHVLQFAIYARHSNN